MHAKRYRIFFCLWILFMWMLTGIPGNFVPQLTSFLNLFQPDKIVHLFLFGIFSWLFLVVLNTGKNFFCIKYAYSISIFSGILFGGLTEIAQKYVFINRSGNVWDFIADTAGVFMGVVFYNLFYKKKVKEWRKNLLSE
jgi:VanZ family protein